MNKDAVTRNMCASEKSFATFHSSAWEGPILLVTTPTNIETMEEWKLDNLNNYTVIN
jgi:hypothetical protein